MSNKKLWRSCFSHISLVISLSEFLLEPVYHILERIMVLMMEEVTSRFHFYELLHKLLLWHVCKDNVLRVLVEDCELVRDARSILLFFLFNSLLEFINILAPKELWMLSDFSKRSVARCDVSLNNLLKIIISLIADPEFRSNICTNCFVMLSDVDMNDIGFIELPCQSDVI